MRSCPCGHLGDLLHPCTCRTAELRCYWRPLAANLLDRFDLTVEVPLVRPLELRGHMTEGTADVARRVALARRIQAERFGVESPVRENARIRTADLGRHCSLDRAGGALLETAVQRLGFAPRAVHAILRVSRTVADLTGSESIRPSHLAEAIQYRALALPPVSDEKRPVIVRDTVWAGLDAVQRSGLTNMLNRLHAAQLARELGFQDAANWISLHPADYARGVLRGFRQRSEK